MSVEHQHNAHCIANTPNYVFIIILYCYSLLVKTSVSRMVCVVGGGVGGVPFNITNNKKDFVISVCIF